MREAGRARPRARALVLLPLPRRRRRLPRSGGRGRCPKGRPSASGSASSPAPIWASAGSTPTPTPPPGATSIWSCIWAIIIYEFEQGRYPTEAETRRRAASIDPPTEAATLAGYRLRHAAYRRDPDLQALHQMFPMVMMWDDHESANDSWHGGAANHQPETEGAWEVRKAAAKRAYREWLPVSDEDWESYEIGDLATLFRPGNAADGALRAAEPAARCSAAGGDPARRARRLPRRGLARSGAHHDGPGAGGLAGGRACAAPSARAHEMAIARPAGDHGLGPAGARSGRDDDPAASERVRREVAAGLAAVARGPALQPRPVGRLSGRARAAAALGARRRCQSRRPVGRQPQCLGLRSRRWADAAAGVEFAGQSVTSPGYEAYMPWVDPADLARVSVAFNPQLKWMDTSRRGYMTLDADAGARDRRMAVPRHGPPALHRDRGAARHERARAAPTGSARQGAGDAMSLENRPPFAPEGGRARARRAGDAGRGAGAGRARLHPRCRERRAAAALGDAVDALRARRRRLGAAELAGLAVAPISAGSSPRAASPPRRSMIIA